MDYEYLHSIFPHYTYDMYIGNTPNRSEDLTDYYSCFYGGGSVTVDGELLNAQVSLQDKNNTIYIVGDNVELMHIPYDGVPHYWKWTNKDGFLVHGKDCLPKYPKDYVYRLLKKKRDMDGTYLWEKVKNKFIEEFEKKEGK